MLPGTLGAKLMARSPGTRPHVDMCQIDFRSDVLRGVVTEQQFDFFRVHRYFQVTSSDILYVKSREYRQGS